MYNFTTKQSYLHHLHYLQITTISIITGEAYFIQILRKSYGLLHY